MKMLPVGILLLSVGMFYFFKGIHEVYVNKVIIGLMVVCLGVFYIFSENYFLE